MAARWSSCGRSRSRSTSKARRRSATSAVRSARAGPPRSASASAAATSAASPAMPTVVAPCRSSSSGSTSTLISVRSGSTPHRVSGHSSRDPIPSTTSASAQRSRPTVTGTNSGWRVGTVPWPMRRVVMGACRSVASSAISWPASCAPPPITISGRSARASSAAARSTRVAVDGRAGRDRVAQGRLGGRRPAVGRHLDADRSGSPRDHCVHRRLDLPGRGGRVDQELGPLRHLAQDRGLVGQLVQDAPAPAERGGRDLPDDGQRAGVAPVPAGQRRAGVEQARPRAPRRRPTAAPSPAPRRPPCRPRPARGG